MTLACNDSHRFVTIVIFFGEWNILSTLHVGTFCFKFAKKQATSKNWLKCLETGFKSTRVHSLVNASKELTGLDQTRFNQCFNSSFCIFSIIRKQLCKARNECLLPQQTSPSGSRHLHCQHNGVLGLNNLSISLDGHNRKFFKQITRHSTVAY